MAPAQPTRAAALAELAPKQEVMHNLPLHIYYRSADATLLKVDSARLAGEDDNLYVYLLRWSSLVMETIPQHKDAKGPEFAAHQKECMKRLVMVMGELEKLKEVINQRPATLDLQPSSRSASTAASEHSRFNTPAASAETSTTSFAAPKSPKPSSSSSAADGGLFNGTALAGSIPRASAAGSLGSVATPSAPPFQPSAPPWSMLPTSSPQVAYPSLGHDSDAMAKLHALSIRGPNPPAHAAMPVSALRPSPSASPMPLQRTLPLPPQPVMVSYQSAPPPGHAALHGPNMCQCCRPPPFWPQQQARGQPPPPPRRNLVAGFKDLHIHPRLLEEFLSVAAANTRANLETCAILAGRLIQGAFLVTTLLIPKQESTSDTCSTLDEEGLFNLMDARSLCSLGWVHTHPTQTCFMSSVDLHTHAGYQTLLDESVAIVMAPQDPSRRFGIFRLVTPDGLRMIQRCRERGFHPHAMPDGGEIYEHSSHVLLDEMLQFDVADMRS